jgi:hypothetical protein
LWFVLSHILLRTPENPPVTIVVSVPVSNSVFPAYQAGVSGPSTAVRVVDEAIEFLEMWNSRRLVCRNAFHYDPLSLCKTVWSFLFALF